MMAVPLKICRLLLPSKIQASSVFNVIRTFGVSSTRSKLNGIFPDHYIKPVIDPNAIEQMAETGEIKDREFTPIMPAWAYESSSVFHDPLVTKLQNHLMKCGRKDVARKLIDEIMFEIKRLELKRYREAESEEERSQTILDPYKVIKQAIENCRPLLNVQSIKRGAVKYQVPVPITENRSYFMSVKWLVEASRDKGTKEHLPPKMAKELVDAAYNKGRVIKKKQDLHKLCEANRAYAHYRWG